MLEWLAAIAVFVLLLALLPGTLRRSKAKLAKGSGVVLIGIGLGFAAMFDPKIAQAMEIVEQKKEKAEEEESGDQT